MTGSREGCRYTISTFSGLPTVRTRHRVVNHEVRSGTRSVKRYAVLAACWARRKALVCKVKGNGVKLCRVLAILAGRSASRPLSQLASHLGGHALPASPAEVDMLTGCVFAIPPFSFHPNLNCRRSALLERFDEIAFNAGLLEKSSHYEYTGPGARPTRTGSLPPLSVIANGLVPFREHTADTTIMIKMAKTRRNHHAAKRWIVHTHPQEDNNDGSPVSNTRR